MKLIVELCEPSDFLSERSTILLNLDFHHFDCFSQTLDFGFSLIEPTAKRDNALLQLVGKILGFCLVASAGVECGGKRVVKQLVFRADFAFEQLYATVEFFIFLF